MKMKIPQVNFFAFVLFTLKNTYILFAFSRGGETKKVIRFEGNRQNCCCLKSSLVFLEQISPSQEEVKQKSHQVWGQLTELLLSEVQFGIFGPNLTFSKGSETKKVIGFEGNRQNSNCPKLILVLLDCIFLRPTIIFYSLFKIRHIMGELIMT